MEYEKRKFPKVFAQTQEHLETLRFLRGFAQEHLETHYILNVVCIVKLFIKYSEEIP